MLSNTSEYALRIMVLLAKQKSDFFLIGGTIAKKTKVPEAYLAKILQSLNRAGLVLAQKGKGGGYTLNKPPEKISLFDVIDAVDPFIRITKCPLGIPKHKALCPLHKKLDNAYAELKKTLENCMLDHFTQNPNQPTLCTDDN